MSRKGPGSRRATGATEAMTMLDDALARMPYGISAWSDDHRLLFWNEAYLRLYDLPPDRIFPGMTLRERVELSIADGNHPGESIEYLVARLRKRLEANRDPASPAVHVDKVEANARRLLGLHS